MPRLTQVYCQGNILKSWYIKCVGKTQKALREQGFS